MRRVVVLITALVALSASGAAQASVRLGAPLTGTLVNSNCTTGPFCTHVTLTAPADRVLTAPFDGVLVRWSTRVQNGAASKFATLRVLRQVSAPSTFFGVRSSDSLLLPVGVDVTATSATRVPIAAGERIGLDLPQSVGVYAADLGGAPVSKDGWDPLLAKGETRASSGIAGGGAEVQVQAILEPDADRDGFGDETQDLCPTDASTQGLCPVDLSVTKVADRATATVGDSITYTLVVNNNSAQSPAKAVTLSDALPANVTLVSAASTVGTCVGAVNCSLGDLPKGGTATVTVVVQGAAPGIATDLAQVAGSVVDPNPANNSASASTTVLAQFPGVQLLSQVLTPDSRGRVKVSVTCPAIAVGNCVGTDTLARAVRRSPRRVTVGSARFSIAPAQTRNVTIALSRPALTLLATARTLKVRQTAIAQDPRGATRTTTSVITLKKRVVRPRRARTADWLPGHLGLGFS
jgi:uncharacterized repeat protein (TIGR01451 family)